MQVKETDDVVLAGAYVDLHEAAVASPEEISQVCQTLLFLSSEPQCLLKVLSFFPWRTDSDFEGSSASRRAGRRPAERAGVC